MGQPAPGDELQRIELLRRTRLFEGLSEVELIPIARLMRRRRYRKGMFIFVEGEPVDAVYVVESGSVKASTASPDGRQHILGVMGPGDFFPHVGFLDGGPAPGTAEALEDTTAWVIERSALYQALLEHPAVAVRLIALLSQRIRKLQAQVRELATQDVASRLAGALVRLAREHGAAHPLPEAPQAVRIGVRLSHQDLAALVGTARETVSRVLAAFRKAGLVRVERGYLVVLDMARLERWQ